MTKASIHIEDYDGDNVRIWAEFDPEPTEEQREGRAELPYTHALVGAVLASLESELEAVPTEGFSKKQD